MISITEQAIDVAGVLASVASEKAGAVVSFIGTVREEGNLAGFFYECHPEMAERILAKICDQAKNRWPIEKISVVHRTGWVPVGEASIVIAVSAPHRKEAFEACRFVIEEIKKEAPIWKRGSTWCHCEQSEAIQLSQLDRHAPSGLAMTDRGFLNHEQDQ